MVMRSSGVASLASELNQAVHGSICARPGCGKPLPNLRRRGKDRKFHASTCRVAFWQDARRLGSHTIFQSPPIKGVLSWAKGTGPVFVELL